MAKPRYVFRGLRRAILRRVVRSLDMLDRMDDRSEVRAGNEDQEPVLFVANQAMQNRIDGIKDRALQLLALKQ